MKLLFVNYVALSLILCTGIYATGTQELKSNMTTIELKHATSTEKKEIQKMSNKTLIVAAIPTAFIIFTVWFGLALINAEYEN